MAIHHAPPGFHTVTPYLTVTGAAKVLAFAVAAFDAEVIRNMTGPDGTVLHAELRIGDSMVELAEAHDPWKPMPTGLHVYVPDCDAVYRKAIEAGGTSLQEPKDQFYGERSGAVADPAGNYWYMATRIEDVTDEQVAERMAELEKA